MEPLGSITLYLPFVDEQTREAVLVLMEESHSYGDFVRRICWKVIEEDSEPMLVFLARRYALDLWDNNLLRRISQKYGERHPLIPTWDSEELRESLDVESYVEDALSTNPDPWIEYHLYGLLAERARTESIGSAVEESSLNKMQQLLDLHPELAPFEPYLLWKQSEVLRSDHRYEEAVSMLARAVETVTGHDDLAYLEKLHVRTAYYIRNQDPLKALEHLEICKDLRRRLGMVPVEYYNLLNIKGLIHSATGEYDAALKCFFRAMNNAEVPGTNVGMRFLPANVASVYNRMGRHAEALEYARMAVELGPFTTDSGLYRPYAHCHLAISLAGLGKIDEALENLRTAQELTMKSGSNRMTALCLVTSGFIESAEGNLASAMRSFQDALDVGIPQDYTRTLVELTRTEVELFTPAESNCADDTSGHWMQCLDKDVSSGYKPGFVGLALLLKAELRRKQGRYEDEDQLLRRVRSMSEDPKIGFLRDLLIQFIRVSPQRE